MFCQLWEPRTSEWQRVWSTGIYDLRTDGWKGIKRFLAPVNNMIYGDLLSVLKFHRCHDSSQIPEFFWYDLCELVRQILFFVDGQDAIVVIRTSLQLTRMRRGPKLRLQRLDGKWRVQVKYPSWEKHSWIQIQIDRIYRVKDGFWGKGPARVWDSAWGLKAVVQAKEQKDLDPDCTWWVLNAKKVGVWVGMSCSDLTESWFHDTAESMDLGTPTHVIAIPKLLFHKQRGVNGSSNLWGDPLWQFLEKTWDHVGICGNLWYLPQEVDTIGWPVTLRFLLGVWTQSKGCLCEVSWHNSFDILIALTWNSCSSYRFSCILEKNLRDLLILFGNGRNVGLRWSEASRVRLQSLVVGGDLRSFASLLQPPIMLGMCRGWGVWISFLCCFLLWGIAFTLALQNFAWVQCYPLFGPILFFCQLLSIHDGGIGQSLPSFEVCQRVVLPYVQKNQSISVNAA